MSKLKSNIYFIIFSINNENNIISIIRKKAKPQAYSDDNIVRSELL